MHYHSLAALREPILTLCLDGQLDLFEDIVPSGDWLRSMSSWPTPSRDPLRVAGLFAGIGGFELGLRRAGHETVLLCENDPGANAVLDARFPSIERHGDVTRLDALPANTDLVAAGFPCQDLSQAGRTAGIAGSNSGLVSSIFRLLGWQRIPWVLIENVSFMLRLGKGRALSLIVDELERLGYAWAYRVVDSRGFGLPQRRQRVFLLASLDEDPRSVLFADESGSAPLLDPDRERAFGFYWTEGIRGLGWADDAIPTLKGGSTVGIPSAPAIVLPSRDVITPDIRDAERLQGFSTDWTRPAEAVGRRGHRWKLVGNAVTVDAAEWVGRRLRGPGRYDASADAPLCSGSPWPTAAWGVAGKRATARVSGFPVWCEASPLHRFLRYPGRWLSAKATAGFLSRTRISRLRFPAGFLDTLEVHLARMREQDYHLREEQPPSFDVGPRDLGEARTDPPAEDGPGDGRPTAAPPAGHPLPGEQPGFAW